MAQEEKFFMHPKTLLNLKVNIYWCEKYISIANYKYQNLTVKIWLINYEGGFPPATSHRAMQFVDVCQYVAQLVETEIYAVLRNFAQEWTWSGCCR